MSCWLAESHFLASMEALNTNLIEATTRGNKKEIKALISAGANVNLARDKHGSTPLHIAAYSGNHSIVELLLKLKASPTARDNEQCTPLHRAVLQPNLKCVQLLTSSATINETDEFGATALHISCRKGSEECVYMLLGAGSDCNLEEKDGSTPLHRACISGKQDIVHMLLNRGAKINAEDKSGLRPLHVVAERGDLTLLKIFCISAELNCVDKSNNTPLHIAAFSGHTQCVEYLCKHGAEVNYGNGVTTALHQAAFSGHAQIISILLDKGAVIDCTDTEGATPLHKACFNGHVEAAKILLERGANSNAKDAENRTPLHSANTHGHTNCVALLIQHKADVNAVDGKDATPLHYAAAKGYIDCVKLLIEGGAAIDAEDHKGSTALQLAAKRGHKACVVYLIKNKAAINHQNDKGATALHCAVKHPSCVSKLLKAGAEVDIKDWSGRTPLFYAVRSNSEESTRTLIFRGADVNATDKNNKSPMDASKILSSKVINKILKDKSSFEQSQTNREHKEAVKKFNMKPQLGIAYLIDNKVTRDNPEDIASFLHSADGLNKNKIGEYLGENDELAKKVLKEYVNKIDFSQFEFDHALRYFLSKFRLPGEAQKIDRIMERFAAKYTQDNPKIFSHEDSAYLLAFSIIMLNTDAHNPNIKKDKKMTKADWIKNNKGVNGGLDLPESFLETIYNRIVREEIKMDSTESDYYVRAEKKGYLVKQGGRIKTWKRRWFVVSDNCLYYFKSHEVSEPIGIIPLENLSVRRVEGKREYSFELYQSDEGAEVKSAKFDSKGAIVKGHHESYIIGCQSEEELNEWVRVITANIFKNPFVELVQKKLATQRLFNPKRLSSRSSNSAIDIQRRQNSSDPKDWKLISHVLQLCVHLERDKQVNKLTPFGAVLHHNSLAKKKFEYHIVEGTDYQYIVLLTRYWPKDIKKEFLRWQQHNQKDPFTYYKLHIYLQQVSAECKSALKKNSKPIIITGTSLFATVAVELAIALADVQFKIFRIITFGQPKVKKDQIAYDKVPVWTIINAQDPITALFPDCTTAGDEISINSPSEHSGNNATPLELYYYSVLLPPTPPPKEATPPPSSSSHKNDNIELP